MTLTIKSKQIKRLYDVCNKDHDKKSSQSEKSLL